MPRLEQDSKPFRAELLSIDRLEERAASLAAAFVVAPRRARAENILHRFRDNARALRRAYRILANDLRASQPVAPASEWFLDNFHLIVSEVRDIYLHLPRNFYRKLPVLASPDHGHQVRVYAMAVELLRHSDSRIDRHQLTSFINSYQRIAPLTIGELWAWPTVLKLALIENLRRLSQEIIDAREARLAADAFLANAERQGATPPSSLPAAIQRGTAVVQLLHRMREYGMRLSTVRTAIEDLLAARGTTPEDIIRADQRQQAATQESVANAITSLRLCSVMDWREFFESVSLVEQVCSAIPQACIAAWTS